MRNPKIVDEFRLVPGESSNYDTIGTQINGKSKHIIYE